MKAYQHIALITAIISAGRFVYFFPSMGNGYYVFLAVCLALLLLIGTKSIVLRFSGLFLFAACAASIFANEIPRAYHPWLRLGLFAVVVLLVGPFLSTSLLRKFRHRLFWYMELGLTLIALLSFIGRFVGLSLTQGRYWCGITAHSMLLGIVAANAGVFLLYLLTGNNELTIRQRWTIGGILIVALIMMLGAASRAALLAFIGGSGVSLYVLFKDYSSKVVKKVLVFAIVIVCLWPALEQYTSNVKRKNSGNIIQVDLSSRQDLWERNWEAFNDNPYFGIGFAFETADSSGFGRGRVEPGSSWLAVLSMTGMFGGICVFVIMLWVLLALKKIHGKNKNTAALLYGLFAFYIVHMCAEGYIFSGGSMACFNFWLLLGMIESEASNTVEENFTDNGVNKGSLQNLIQLLTGHSLRKTRSQTRP